MVRIAHASKDEKGSIKNGQAGDQTGQEVYIRTWYSRPWNYVIRCNDCTMAEKIAKAMESACQNNHIGYDQNQRNTALTQAKKHGYDPSSIVVDCETDCSALVSLACMYAGVPESVLVTNGNSATTSTLRSKLVSTGKFTVYTSSNYVSSSDYLKRGDILLYEKHHVAVVLDDGIYAGNKIATEVKKDDYIYGIDTSVHQGGKVNYSLAKAFGYDFVILRIGNTTVKDSRFETDYINAMNSGLDVGVYLYTKNLTVASAVEDGKRVLQWLNKRKLTMPVVYDMEEASMKSSSRKVLNSQMYNAFAEVIRNGGYVPMLYTGESMYNNYFDSSLISDYLWIAKYSINNGKVNKFPTVKGNLGLFQYTSAPISNDFYKDKLDRNIMLVDKSKLMNDNNSVKNTTNTIHVTKNTIIMKGQVYANSYAKTGLVADGERGVKTKQGAIKVLQHSMNLDYGNTIVEDGIYGAKTKAKLCNHYVKRGEKQYMVTAAEILLMLKGYDPNGVEIPGIFGNGLETTVRKYQLDNGLPVTGIVNNATFLSLID